MDINDLIGRDLTKWRLKRLNEKTLVFEDGEGSEIRIPSPEALKEIHESLISLRATLQSLL